MDIRRVNGTGNRNMAASVATDHYPSAGTSQSYIHMCHVFEKVLFSFNPANIQGLIIIIIIISPTNSKPRRNMGRPLQGRGAIAVQLFNVSLT